MKNIAIVFSSLFTLAACGGGGGGKETPPPPPPPPKNANPTVTITSTAASFQEGTTVTLSYAATDSDGQISSLDWSTEGGLPVDWTVDSETQTVTFTSPSVLQVDGNDITKTFTYSLTATDNDNGTTTKSISIDVQSFNKAPSINIISDDTAPENTLMTLSAAADENVSFAWTTNNNEITLAGADSENATFTTPSSESRITYTFTLTVLDDEGKSVEKVTEVTVNPVITGLLVGKPAAQTKPTSGNTNEAEYQVVALSLLTGSEIGAAIPNSDGTYLIEVTKGNDSLDVGYTIVSQHRIYAHAKRIFKEGDIEVYTLNGEFVYQKADNGDYNCDESIDGQGSVTFQNCTENLGNGTHNRIIYKIGDVVYNDDGTAQKAYDENNNPILEASWADDLKAICYADIRNECQLTPVTTLVESIMSAADPIAGDTYTQEDHNNAIIKIEQRLGVDFSSDPFIYTDVNSTINFDAISTFIDNGTGTKDWVKIVSDFVNNSGEDSTQLLMFFPSIDNNRLAVSAGSDISTSAYRKVTINGSSSFEGSNATENSMLPFTYSWQQLSGPSVSMIDQETLNVTLKIPALEQESLIIMQLTVSSGDFTVSATVNLNVSPDEPPENTSPFISDMKDIIASSGTTVYFSPVTGDGQDFPAELSYEWAQISGPTANIINPTNAAATVVVPIISGVPELGVFQLLLTDSGGKFKTKDVSVWMTKSVTLQPIPLNDTGITLCADYAYGEEGSRAHSNTLDCTNHTDIDPISPVQDAHTGRDFTLAIDENGVAGFDYTKIADDGSELADTATEWSCIKDNVTRLIWENKNNNPNSIHYGEKIFSFYNDNPETNGGRTGHEVSNVCDIDDENCLNTKELVTQVNETGLCGYTDWRLPHRLELMSLVNYGGSASSAMIDNDYFQYTSHAGVAAYLTDTAPGEPRTPGIYETRKVWIVSFSSGEMYFFNKDVAVGDDRQPARLVRSTEEN